MYNTGRGRERVTVQELRQLFYLNKAIEREQSRLDDLRASVALKSPVYTDMPKAPGVRDKIGETVPAIVDQENEIMETLRKYREARDRLQTYIQTVPSMRIRLILSYRFLDMMSWQEVADAIGGNETEYSVKQACYRYVEGKTYVQIPGQMSLLDDPQFD